MFESYNAWFSSLIESMMGLGKETKQESKDILHVFDKVFHGFLARLTKEEDLDMECM